MAKKKSSLMLFEEAVRGLGYDSIGEFMELLGGFAALVANEKYDTATVMADRLALQIGSVIEKMGHLEVVKARNELLKKADNIKQNVKNVEFQIELNEVCKNTVNKMMEKKDV
jgi:hypothetical protein